ncbi:hypothetical protein B0J14DRAFT_450333, partial [Halenospora varia]
VANVPFQFVCILLEMDMQESLAKVGEAMRTLREVAECFPTQATRNSVEAARGLLKAAQDRKVADVVLLDQGLETDQELSSRRDEERPVVDAATPVG